MIRIPSLILLLIPIVLVFAFFWGVSRLIALFFRGPDTSWSDDAAPGTPAGFPHRPRAHLVGPRCTNRHCRHVNRPAARYCAQCGQVLRD